MLSDNISQIKFYIGKKKKIILLRYTHFYGAQYKN